MKKYYAIKKGHNTVDKIVTTWEECQKLVKGYPSIYKSFKTEDEAQVYLRDIKDVDKKLEKNRKAQQYTKKRKAETTYLKGVRVPNELMQKFKEKCNRFKENEESVIVDLIKEWVD